MAAHSHPRPRDYWLIAFVLAVITAAEVAVAYWTAVERFIAPILIIMSALKFVITRCRKTSMPTALMSCGDT